VNVSDAGIKERDGNRCAHCGRTDNLHIHHRMLRSAGSDERACNRVTLCAFCHRWAHHNREAARDEGWIVLRTSDPAEVPITHVLWPAGPVLLTDENAGVQVWVKDD